MHFISYQILFFCKLDQAVGGRCGARLFAVLNHGDLMIEPIHV